MRKTAVSVIFFFIFMINIGLINVSASDIPILNIVINTPGNGAAYIQLDWKELSSSGYYYQAERKINNGSFESFSGYLDSATNTTVADILLATDLGAVCSYRLAVYDSSYNFVSYSNVVSFILSDSAEPTNFKAENIADNKISLSWEYKEGTPLSTIIERKTDDEDWRQIGGTNGSDTYFEDLSIVTGKTYTYRIKSILGANCYSRYVETSISQTRLSTPDDINVSLIYLQSKQQVIIEWANTWSQDVNIVLERKENSGNFEVIKTLYNDEALYLDDDVVAGSTYTYRIKAKGRYTGFESPYSEEFTIIVIDIKAPTGFTAIATTNTSVELNWVDNSNNESGYEIWKRNGDGTSWSKYAVVGTNVKTFTDKNLSPAYTYSYKIRAFSAIANVHSYFSPEITVKTLIPNTNVILDYSIDNDNVPTITWQTFGDIQDTEIYQLERKGEYDLTWSVLPSFSSLSQSFTDSALTKYTRYAYRLKTIDTLNNSASYSNTIEFAPGIPISPSNLELTTLGANTVKLTWNDKSMNETGFIIERYVEGIGFVQLAKLTSNENSYIDNLLTPGKLYSYRVSAYNKSGISGYTNEKFFTAANPITFNDMSDNEWALNAVLNLTDMGVIKGTSSGNFSPNNTISRAEFVSMIIKALKIKKISSTNFIDVKPRDWYYEDIITAKGYGIISGSNGYFNPESPITREDMSIILCKALEVINKPIKGADLSILDNYEDRSSVSDYALSFLSSLKAEGFINGKEGNRLAPKAYLTRAEAATIIWRVISSNY